MNSADGSVPGDDSFSERLHRHLATIERRLGIAAGECSFDVLFLAFLQLVARFGYFTLGPITIDVRLIEDIVERTARPDTTHSHFVRLSQLLMQEVKRSGRRTIDELHYLLAFMRCGEGLPARVFGELGVTPEQIERYLRETGGAPAAPTAERLLTPEEVADYLKVHVQTVRAWIRSGRLPARRVAGLRALRVRAADVEGLLEPVGDDD
jgi:excisionase family DNA binding protein